MTYLLLWSLRALAVTLVGGLIVVALRKRSAALRNLIVRLTLLVAFALPLFSLVAPQIRLHLPAATVPAAPLASAPSVADAAAAVTAPTPPLGWALESAKDQPVQIVRREPFRTMAIDLTSLLLPLYGLGVIALVGRWTVGMFRLRKIARVAKPSVHDPTTRCAAVSVPVTFGRTILLPLEADGWPADRRRAAILHEEAHVRRKDWAWQTLAALFAALHWANPAAWILVRVLRDTAEAAADDEVLATGLTPSDYARQLLAVAKTAGRSGPALAMARRGGVRDRVVAILSTNRDRRYPTRTAALLVLTPLLLCGLVLAGMAAGNESAVKLDERASADTQAGPFPLGDGRTAEIVELRDRFGRGVRSWSPEGIAAERTVESWRDIQRGTMPPGTRRIQLLVRITGKKVEDPHISLVSGSQLQFLSNGGSTVSSAGSTERFTCDVPDRVEQEDVQIKFASGGWERDSRPVSVLKTVRQLNALRIDGKSLPLVRVTVTLPRDLRSRDLQLAAFDRKGSRFRLQSTGLPSGLLTREDQATADFSFIANDVSDVDRVEFRSRQWKTIRFRGIHLQPEAKPVSQAGESASPAKVAGPKSFGPVRLEDGRTTRLAAVHDPTSEADLWAPDGQLAPESIRSYLPKPPSGITLSPRKGFHRLDFVILTQGMPRREPSVDPSFTVEVRQGGGWGSWGQARSKTEYAYVASIPMPVGARSTDLRVGYASGIYTKEPVSYRLEKASSSLYERGTNQPLIRVHLRQPLPTEGEVRVVAYDKAGRPLRQVASGSDTLPFFDVLTAVPPAKVMLERRPYEWVVFRGVLLGPTGVTLRKASRPFSKGEMIRLSSGHFVELLGIRDVGKDWNAGWRPDGTPVPDFNVPPAQIVGQHGKRNLAFGLRMTGPALVEPRGRIWSPQKPLALAGVVYGSSEPKEKTERTLWAITPTDPDLGRSDIAVELDLGPWREEASYKVGRDGAVAQPFRVQATRGSRGGVFTRVTLPRRTEVAKGRAVELLGLDARGEKVGASDVTDLVTSGMGRVFVLDIQQPERVVRWTLRSRVRSTATFSGVALKPRRP